MFVIELLYLQAKYLTLENYAQCNYNGSATITLFSESNCTGSASNNF